MSWVQIPAPAVYVFLFVVLILNAAPSPPPECVSSRHGSLKHSRDKLQPLYNTYMINPLRIQWHGVVYRNTSKEALSVFQNVLV